MARSGLSRSWKNQPLALSILRIWLGVTWVYAGWNKATDSGFLNAASSHYIGTQLTGYLGHSPISFLLRKMIEHATLVGCFVTLSEFAIGFAVLSGVAISLAAIGGAGMSAMLWLSSSWSVKPYFLGSDTAYLVLWIVLLALLLQRPKGGRRKGGSILQEVVPNLSNRREVVRLIGVGVAAVAGALAGGALKRKIDIPISGSAIAKLSDLPIGSTLTFQATDGTPAILFRTKVGVFAYSATCTHQGCVVAYSATSHLIECPCHGAAYDPNKGAAVVAGPAPAPLAKIKVAISGANIVQI
ncbi:MAG: TQO small subunit DoxD [Actinomycetes bacterium]